MKNQTALKQSEKIKFRLIIGIILFAGLLPTLFFPISSDFSIFYLGAKAIAESKLLYVDFVDLKPPAIFYLLLPFFSLFEPSHFFFRILDFLMQFFAACLISLFLLKKTGDRLLACVFAALYGITYSSLNFNQTLQSESFTTIPIALLAIIFIKIKPNLLQLAAAGILIGFLAGIKLTFLSLILIFPLSFYFSLTYSFSKSIQKSFLPVLITFLTLFITYLPLLHSEVFAEWKNVLHYLSIYSSQAGFSSDSFKFYLDMIMQFAGNSFSFAMSFAAAGALIIFFSGSDHKNTKTQNILQIFIIIAALLLISIAAERKFHIYHFVRAWPVLIGLSAFGLSYFIKWLISLDHKKSAFKWYLAWLLVPVVLLLSPLPRFANVTQTAFYYFAAPEKYESKFEVPGASALHRIQHKKVAEFLMNTATKDDLILNISTGGAAINYFLKDYRLGSFMQSCFYLGSEKIPAWQIRFHNELKLAEFLIVQNDDYHPRIYGHNLPSLGALENSQSGEYFKSNFELAFKTENFIVFKRK